MRARNRRRTGQFPSGPIGIAVILGIGVTASLILTVGRRTLAVGDLIVFKGGGAPLFEPLIRIAVHRPDQYGCILNLGTLHQSGGSLVVEARLVHPAPAFRVHWAGARTSVDSGDCGRSADMIIDPIDLASLARAASGYGIGSWRMPNLAPHILD